MLHNEENSANNKELIPTCNKICNFCFLNYTNLLSKNFLFKNLENNKIGNLIKSVEHQSKSYKKGEIILFSGDKYDKLIIIVKGSVTCEIVDFEGKVLQLETITAPDTIAPSNIFGDNNILPHDITSREDSKLLFINKESVLELLMSENKILKNYLDIVANNTHNLSNRIKMLGLQSIREKIAMFFLEQVNKRRSNTFRLDKTHAELSDIFGVERPSLSREIRKLNNEGLIESKGKNITIKNKQALSDIVN